MTYLLYSKIALFWITQEEVELTFFYLLNRNSAVADFLDHESSWTHCHKLNQCLSLCLQLSLSNSRPIYLCPSPATMVIIHTFIYVHLCAHIPAVSIRIFAVSLVKSLDLSEEQWSALFIPFHTREVNWDWCIYINYCPFSWSKRLLKIRSSFCCFVKSALRK